MTYGITHYLDTAGYLVVKGDDGDTTFEHRLNTEMAAVLRPLLPLLLGPADGIQVRSHGYDGDVTATFEADSWKTDDDGNLDIDSGDLTLATYRAGAWISVGFVQPEPVDDSAIKVGPSVPLAGVGGDTIHVPDGAMWRVPDGPIVHAVMYRDHRMGTLCDSGAWGTPDLFTAVTEHVTCPGCRDKLDPGRS